MFKKNFKRIFSSELGRGSFVLFVTMNVFFFLNFLFHVIMARQLGPAGYGILAVLMSFVYIFGAPTEAIQSIVSRYTSKFNLKNDDGKIKFLMFKGVKKGFKVALVIFLISIPFSIFLSYFLDINFWLIVFTNVYIFSAFSLPIIRGVLQGRKKFGFLGFGMVLESLLKLIFAISFVIFGFKVFGAMAAVLIGVFSGLIFSLYFTKDILKEKQEKTSFKEIYPQSVIYFISMLVVLLMFSLDIILAKRFFSPELAGQYSVLSMIGKMIFLGTIAIGKTMFPLISEKHDRNQDTFNLFKKSFLIISVLCLASILVYALLPKLIIFILYGGEYINMAPFLVYSGIALSFLSLSNVVLLYGLSTNRLKKSHYLFGFLFIEVVLLFLFHKTILEYILAFMVSNIIMFIGTLFLIKK